MFRGPKCLKVNSVKVAASEAQVLQGLGHGLEDLTQAAHQVVEAEVQADQKREGRQEVAQGLAVLCLAARAPVLTQRNGKIHLWVCACCCIFLVGGDGRDLLLFHFWSVLTQRNGKIICGCMLAVAFF